MKIISQLFVVNRVKSSRDVALILAGAPTSFIWPLKPNQGWSDDIVLLDQLESAEILKRTDWRNAAESWQADIDLVQEITRDAAGFGVVKFRDTALKVQMFERLRTDGRSRSAIEKQGKAARDAWAAADATWIIKKELPTGVIVERTLSEFSSLIATAEAKEDAHGPKEKAWRNAVAALGRKIRDANRDCLDWYADVTRFFQAGTTAGDMIRASVPTTTQAEEPVGQAVISNQMASGGTIHFDAAAEHATKFTYLHKAPGAPAFVVVVTDSPESHLTLHNQAVGVHEFKAIGGNSRGEGPESAVVQVTVAQQNVA